MKPINCMKTNANNIGLKVLFFSVKSAVVSKGCVLEREEWI